jgi:hypothetical protein
MESPGAFKNQENLMNFDASMEISKKKKTAN